MMRPSKQRADVSLKGPFVLVPVAVRALPVDKDGNYNKDGQPHWANLTPDWGLPNSSAHFVLGKDITPDFFSDSKGKPYPGMHLHWALPDGLTHGTSPQASATLSESGGVASVSVENGSWGFTAPPQVTFVGGGGSGATASAVLSNGVITSIKVEDPGKGYTSPPAVSLGGPHYPLVPNRWFVGRIFADNTTQKIQVTAWVVQSDVIATEQQSDENRPSSAWPAGHGEWLTTTKYIGAYTPYSKWSGDSGNDQLFLTAIGPGDPAFAAFTGSCQNVFAFNDDFSDNPHLLNPANQIGLTYLVAGWYSNPEADPLYACEDATSWTQRMSELNWQVTPPYPVGGADSTTNSFTISNFGNLKARFPVGGNLEIVGSTSYDGSYTVKGTTYKKPDFTLAVDANVPKGVADGYVVPYGTVLPKKTLCHGMVYGAPWLGTDKTVPPQVPASGDLDLAIGNTSAEALAAIVASKMGGVDSPLVITGVNQTTRTFTTASPTNKSNLYPDGTGIYVSGSPGNDGSYTIKSTAYEPGTLTIVVDQAIPDAIAGGQVSSLPMARVLEALQYHLLSDLDPPDAIVNFEQALHNRCFQRRPGGLTWGIQEDPRPDARVSYEICAVDQAARSFTVKSDTDPSAQFPESSLIQVAHSLANDGNYTVESVSYTKPSLTIVVGETIPDASPAGSIVRTVPPLGMLLSELNNQQHVCDELSRQIESVQRETYFAWYKRTVVEQLKLSGGGPTSQHGPAKIKMRKLNELIDALLKELESLTELYATSTGNLLNSADAIRAELEGAGLVLVSSPMPRFWQPADPVLLAAGDAIGRSYKHGEDGRLSPGDDLVCRVSGETITTLTVTPPGADSPVAVEQALLQKYFDPPLPDGATIPTDIVPLLIEAVLLDPLMDTVLAYAAYSQTSVSNPDYAALEKTIENIQTGAYQLHTAASYRIPAWVVERTAAEGGLSGGRIPSKLAVSTWAWPWNPLYLGWEVSWYPSYSQGDESKPAWGLFADWQLLPEEGAISEVDYTWTSASSPTVNPSVAYRGAIVVTPNAIVNFAERLRKYAKPLPDTSPYKVMLEKAASTVADLPVLSQGLSGLTSELMLRQQVLQLPLISYGEAKWSDDEYRDKVANSIGNADAVAPLTLKGAYFPIRAGHFEIDALWNIDGFGQIQRVGLAEKKLILSQGVQTPKHPSVAQLPPRISQPSRLSFRLMSGSDTTGTVETNTESDTSPICGWVLPNHLDNSLMVYDPDGEALGELETLSGRFGPSGSDVRWVGVPGQPATVGGVPDFGAKHPHLAGFLNALIDLGARGQDALRDLIPVIDETLWTVDPLGARNDQSLSVLVGRPLALVRARLELQLEGRPAWRQDWEATEATLASLPALDFTDSGFTKIPFPVRLGDIRDTRDGLIGYFVDDGEATYYKFYAVHGAEQGTAASAEKSSYLQYKHLIDLEPAYDNFEMQNGEVVRQPSAKAVFITMLVDPRACVHATSGILPVKTIEVPPSLVARALAAIDVTFLTGPVLSRADQISLPLPAFQKGQWSWIDQPGVTVWENKDKIGPVSDRASLTSTPYRVYEGWLKLSDAFGAPKKNPNDR